MPVGCITNISPSHPVRLTKRWTKSIALLLRLFFLELRLICHLFRSTITRFQQSHLRAKSFLVEQVRTRVSPENLSLITQINFKWFLKSNIVDQIINLWLIDNHEQQLKEDISSTLIWIEDMPTIWGQNLTKLISQSKNIFRIMIIA